jgi:hypothetical protein
MNCSKVITIKRDLSMIVNGNKKYGNKQGNDDIKEKLMAHHRQEVDNRDHKTVNRWILT